jgi:hypothetical protein
MQLAWMHHLSPIPASGVLALATRALRHGIAARNVNALFHDRLTRLEACYPAERRGLLPVQASCRRTLALLLTKLSLFSRDLGPFIALLQAR